MVVHDLELADVAVLLHRLEEFHNHFGARPDEHLALAPLLGVRDALQAIRKDRHPNHDARAATRLGGAGGVSVEGFLN